MISAGSREFHEVLADYCDSHLKSLVENLFEVVDPINIKANQK